jgi:hypothetical protein
VKRPKYPQSSSILPKCHWDFGQIIEIPLGIWPNYQNTLLRSAWAFHGPFWAFSILGFLGFSDFGFLIIN